ncbi:unnamed protein product [Pleuronectes platessa]|uniref:Uncharacterized protein n=1 Tax=Pleuronectes platessa TaxID=8262 RepID=A0A9N7YQN9_PLEPL|nr:unnamed protein product [Pleuronectes platessa]
MGSSSDGSILPNAACPGPSGAADKAGYRLERALASARETLAGVSHIMLPCDSSAAVGTLCPGKGLSHRPRPSSPFSTDGSTVGTHSLGHQRAARPTRKPRSQGTAPHRREAAADDLPPPPEPPPSQGQSRIQGARSVTSMAPPTERKASSLERTPLSGPLSGPEDMKSSMDRQTRTSLEHYRQAQDRLGSVDRAEDGRRGHITEEGCLPYSKPSFPSPGGQSSSGTASSKGSTGPRKGEGPRQPQQWTATEHAEFLGTNGQNQYSGSYFAVRAEQRGREEVRGTLGPGHGEVPGPALV